MVNGKHTSSLVTTPLPAAAELGLPAPVLVGSATIPTPPEPLPLPPLIILLPAWLLLLPLAFALLLLPAVA